MREDAALFFAQKPAALPIFAALYDRVLAEIPEVSLRVQKTQITFSCRHVFACVSFLPARRAKDRPEPYLTLTFGLPYRLASPRIDAAVQPYPNRWTHHVLLAGAEEIDGELMAWVREAAAFSAAKR